MRYQALATVLGYQPLDVFEVDENDHDALDQVEPYVSGGHVVPLIDSDHDVADDMADAVVVDDGPTPEQIADAKGDDLRVWLTEAGLPTSGKVDDLRERLVEHLAG